MQTGMRSVVFLCLAALVIVSAIPRPKTPNCAEYLLPICTRDYTPVCGDDQVEYSNECMLCLWNMEHETKVAMTKKGPC